MNLTRFFNTACTTETFELPTTVTDIISVFGYDIENDGSIGTLGYSWKIEWKSEYGVYAHATLSCTIRYTN